MKISVLVTLTLSTSSLMLSTDSPMLMWMLMEISNIFFLMLFTLMHQNITAPALFFLIQFFSSTFILFGTITNNESAVTMGALMKLGLFPAHIWFPMIILLSSWKLNLYTLTLPKIPPFIILMMTMDTSTLEIMIMSTPILVTAKLIKMNNLKTIVALSSIVHSCWISMSMMMSMKVMSMYMTLYFINTIMICLMMINYKIPKFNSNSNYIMKLVIVMMMFSLIGSPPITMFMTKLYLLSFLDHNVFLPMIILISTSALSIIFYIRMFFNIIFIYKSNPKLLMYPYKKIKVRWILFMMILLLLV